ncbi:SHOCT domain-containing protein [Nocardia seriolae]
MFWYGNGMSGWGYALMTVGMVVFWALVIGGFVALIRSTTTGSDTGVKPLSGPTPQQILAERYARGEIDHEEYAQRLKILESGPSGFTA